jgi:formate dehydrogenase alpha subunit
VAGLVAAFGSGAMTNSIPEFETDTRCFLVIGSNTTEAHPLIASRILHAKERRGAKVIVIDPREVQMARLADLHLSFRPGSDVAVLNGLMNVILSEGLEDRAYIASRTEGYEGLEAAVERYPPERVEEISGIPADSLREAARTYAAHRPAAILYAMGVTQHVTGVDNVLSCANLAMLCGNVGVAGGGVNPLRGQNNVQGACDMGGLPNFYPGYQAVTSPEAREKFERAWGSTSGLEVGLTVPEIIRAVGDGRVRALYVMGENPLVADPDSNHVRHCLERAEFLVVQDIFLSETAQLAHVVLPAVSFVEKDGTYTATDRRAQRVRKVIEPRGDAKADWEILCLLARAMGAGGFDFASPEDVMEEIARLTPVYGGVTYRRLEESGFLHWPCPAPDHPGTPWLHKDEFSRGLGRFHAVEFKEPAELPDETYPLTLTTGRLMFHWHTGTMTRRSEKLRQEVPAAYVEMHPEDVARIGLGDGQRVRVASRRGQIELDVRVTRHIRRGLVFIPFHFAEAAANVLTNAALDPIAKIPEYKVCAVRVEPAGGGRGT